MPEAQQKKKEPVLVLHNTVRRRHTRLKRMQAAGRHRFKQFVGDVRVTRNRPRPVRQSFVEKHLEQLKMMVEEGTMEVRTESGQLVDLETMKAAPPPPPKPQPKPPQDTAANDKPAGSPKPVYEEGKGVDEPVEAPALANDELPEGEEPEVPVDRPSTSGRGSQKKTKKRGSK